MTPKSLYLLLPLFLINILLVGTALFDLIRRERVKGGNKLLWGAIIVLIQYLGPILYLVIGRQEE